MTADLEWLNAVAVLVLGSDRGFLDPQLNRAQLQAEILAARPAMEKRALTWMRQQRHARTPRIQYTGHNRAEVEEFLGFPLIDGDGSVWLVTGGTSTLLSAGFVIEQNVDGSRDKPFRITRGESFDLTDLYQELNA